MRRASTWLLAALLSWVSIVACSGGSGDAGDAAEHAAVSGNVGAPGALGDIDAVPTSPGCVLPDAPPNPVKTTRIATAVTFEKPTGMAISAGGRTFVIEQKGRIRTFKGDDATAATTTLDITPRVKSDDVEPGLLGIALSPQFETNGEIFYSFVSTETGNESWMLERVKTNGVVGDPGTIERVLTIPDYRGHLYGGCLVFGADGMLYASSGAGDESDTNARPQDRNDLHGKLLRIDVATHPYAVPADNPFVGTAGARPEVWAYGFRNPWKFGFDSQDGSLFLADVGAYWREELNLVQKGKNYGWNVMEGTTCFGADTCDTSQSVPPIYEYQHPEALAIVAGVVYRGSKIPALQGSLLHADWAMNWLRALDRQPDGTWKTRFLDYGHWTAGFAEDPVSREVSLVDLVTGGVYRIEANDAAGVMPKTLRATGCADDADLASAAKGFFAYDVNMPLWSDGADKRRFFALPPGGQILVGDHGFFDLPPGSVAFKSFSLANKPIEVRLLVHHKNGEWAGYSYMVRDDGSDADLVSETTDKQIGDQTWTYPGRSQCNGCHNNRSHRPLGLEVAQMNLGSPNQLDALSRVGTFNPPLPPASALPKLLRRDDPDSNEWTRSYLHANCGSCHRKNGILISNMDMRYWTALPDMNMCRPPLASRYDAKGDVFQPGDPDDSVLMARVSRRGPGQMPPLASHVVDTFGVGRVHDFIARTKSCE